MTARTTVWCPTGKGQSLVGRQLLNLLVSNVTAALLQAFCVVTRLSFTKSGCRFLVKSEKFCFLLIY